MELKRFRTFLGKNLIFLFVLIFLGILPFLDGGTSFLAEILILSLPLPLFLLGLATGEICFIKSKLFNWLALVWLFFLVAIFFSAIFSASQIYSIPSFFQILAAFLWFVLFLLLVKRENRGSIFWLFAICGLTLSLVSFWHLLPGVKKPSSGMNLVYADYGHSHLADYLLLVIPLVLAFFLKTEGKLRSFCGGLLAFFLLSLVITFSRGAFLVLPIIVFLLLFLEKPKESTSKILGWLFVFVPLGVLGLIAVFSLSSFGLKAQLAQPQHWLVKQVIKPEFQAKRVDYWLQAWEGFKNRPLFGFGWGAFKIIALRFQKETAGWSTFAHNFYFQTLAEGGIFAFLAFLLFLSLSFFLIGRSVLKNKNDPLLLGGFGGILASLLHSFLDYDWHFPAIFLSFLFLLASLLSLSLENEVKIPLPPWQKWAAGGGMVLLFFFGQAQLLGEYFYQKKDFEKAFLFSPWPVTRVQQIGDKIFEKDFSQGEKIAQKILTMSRQDPSIYYWLGEKYYNRGDLKRTAQYYQKAIEYNPLDNFYLYQKLGEIYAKLGKKREQNELYNFFNQKLEETKFYQKENPRLAKALYAIGKDYLEKNKEETISWWEKAAEAAPQWSFFRIELASLYLKLEKTGEAQKTLEKCLNFYYPQKHCQEYLDRLLEGKEFEEPGFLSSQISAIPEN